MRNRILQIILGALFLTNLTFAQGVCGSYKGYLQDDIKKYPDFYNSLEKQNTELEKANKGFLKNINRQKTIEGKRIIPVVVHVIHEMGNENISASDIQHALDALNKNINGQSHKFLEMYQGQFPKTPDIFASVRGEANVEFRLARLTPVDLNCDTCTPIPTNGIVRVQSDYTNGTEPNNLVKTLSYWNSYQYLNIWVVRHINSDAGTTLGYAQFPQGGLMSTDGIVILWSEMIDDHSTTLTHEVGHWLGLCHTWDCGSGSCGNDGVSDTPPQHTSNGFTTDPGADPDNPNPAKFPWHVGLPSGTFYGCLADSLNPAGEMFMNYMDYTNDDFCTMFSKGQVDIFNETLVGDTVVYGFRRYIWSDDNIAATGIADGYKTPTCKRDVFFDENLSHYSICVGSPSVFKGNKPIFGNSISKWEWNFGDGTTNATGDNAPQHIYSSEGSYDVSLTVEYNETTDARAYNLSDLDTTNSSSYDSIVSTLIVQGTQAELSAIGASNISLHIDEDGYSVDSYWKKNQSTIDSLVGAFNIDTFQIETVEDTIVVYVDGGGNIPTPDSVLFNYVDSIWIYIDGNNLTSQDSVVLETPENSADSSRIWTTEFNVGNIDTIVDYSFYFDTTILNILTYIDSTYLSAADSSLLNSADSSWSIDGLLNSSDSITIYFAQFNMDTIITLSINIDTTTLSASDSLMFNDADSTWSVQSFVGFIDTVRTFYGSHYYTKYNGYYADTLFYRGEIQQTTYIAYYNNNCSSSLTLDNFITVMPTNSSSNASSYTYNFEDPSELGTDWVIHATDNGENIWDFTSFEDRSWERVVNEQTGNASVMMPAKDGNTFNTSSLVSSAYNLSGFTEPAIKFSWSGAAVNSAPVNELNVYYSTDCGWSWKSLGSLTVFEVANAGLYNSNFTPKNHEWNDSIMYDRIGANALLDDNVRFKFEYVTNAESNNFFIDNIQIGEEAALMQSANVNNVRLAIYPNPTSGDATIILENLIGDDVEVKLLNILGAEVMYLYEGTVVDRYHAIDANLSDLENGIYFINVYFEGESVVTDKIILYSK